MVNNYQFPYSKIIRENGEVVPATDHNKQENQLECLTDAVGNYNFLAGSIEQRLTGISTTIDAILINIADIEGDVSTLQTDVTAIDARVTVIENWDLNDLNDVDVPSPAVGEVLTYVGPNWEPRPATTTLEELTDVNITGAQPGDSLVVTGTDGTWGPADRRILVASGAPGSLNESEVFPASEIRFISQSDPGQDHFVIEVENGVAYVGGGPAPDPLSTLTGLTGLVTGRLSNDGSATYPPTLMAGDSYAAITQNATWGFNTVANEFRSASLGNLILAVNGVDVANIDLEVNFVEGDRAIGQNMANYNTQGTGDPIANGVVTFVGGNLTLNSVGPYNMIPTDTYQRGSATVNLTAAALQTGYNIVELKHVTAGTATATLEWFYDTDPDGDPNDPDVTGVTLVENTPVLRYLSGVSYYDAGSTFDLSAAGNDVFNNVYHDSEEPLVTTGNDGPSTTVNWFGPMGFINIADAAVSGVSTPPAIGETMTVTNLLVTVQSGFQISDARALVSPRDPYGSYAGVQSAGNNNVIVSSVVNSTDVYENFRDERYRLPNTTNFNVVVPGMPGAPLLWDSTISLTVGARMSELQVYDYAETTSQNRLRYPTLDYSNPATFQPQPNPNYSGLPAGVRTYYRVFRSTSGDKTNGIITFPGIAEADLGAGIGLRIKVPSKTVWLDLTAAFNGGTFPTGAPLIGGVDGEGCRINAGANNLDLNGRIEFSLGSIGTDLTSDRQLILEITYANSAVTEILGSGAGLSINW